MKNCCSCGRKNDEVSLMIELPFSSKCLCNECLTNYTQVLNIITGNAPKPQFKTPMELERYLSQYVIGQDESLKLISTILYNHVALTLLDNKESNVLIIGPTGVGKSLLIEKSAEILQVPYYIADATALTEAGYAGADVESILAYLIKKANYNLEKAQKGIVYIDEFDKLAKITSSGQMTNRDISGEGVQQSLLKMMDGAEVMVNMKNYGGSDTVKINTKSILFICGGAFSDINYDLVEHNEIIKYGFIPEIIGRLPILIKLRALAYTDFYRILKESTSSPLKKWFSVFGALKIKLVFDDEIIKLFAEKAVRQNEGARGLNYIIDNFMLQVEFVALSSGLKEVVVSCELYEKYS